jgi:hypothetical protein
VWRVNKERKTHVHRIYPSLKALLSFTPTLRRSPKTQNCPLPFCSIMKLDATDLRYITSEQFRVLTAVRQRARLHRRRTETAI